MNRTIEATCQLRDSTRMTFPSRIPESPEAFIRSYFDHLSVAASSVDPSKIAQAIDLINQAHKRQATLFSCGNGGSAAISNHLHCDHLKGCQTDTQLRPRVVSLSSTIETITAIANDISFDDVFLYQLSTMANCGDVLITISASGNSENIVRACRWAKTHDIQIISMTGFDGGQSATLSDVNLHVKADNYGIIEDIHQSLMHILAQYIRLKHMDITLVKEKKF